MTMFKFNTLGAAKRFAYTCIKMKMIVMGDDELFWVVRPVDGERLVKAGYEYAE